MSPETHIPPLKLHQYRYGELDRQAAQQILAHVEGCERCRSRLQGQQATRREFELMPVPAAIRAAAHKPARRPWWHWAGAPALAAAALALFLLVPPQADEAGGVGGVRYKSGADPVEILVEGQGLYDGSRALQKGDRIQLRVAPGTWTHAWVGDSSELVASFETTPGRATLAPFSFTVDGASDSETIVVVLSDHPLSKDVAEEALNGTRMNGVVVASKTVGQPH